MAKIFFDVCFELIFTFPKHAHPRVHRDAYPKLSLLFSTALCVMYF